MSAHGLTTPLASGAELTPWRLVRGALLVGLLVLLSVGMAEGFERAAPSGPLAVAGGLALTGALALAVLRYDAAVAVGILLLGFVRIEPAPTDGLFAVIIAVAMVTGRFRARRVPLVVLAFLGGLIALNLLSALEAVDTVAAARFFTITLFLALFAVWLCGYLDSPRRARLVVLAYLGVALVSSALGIVGYFGRVGTFLGNDASRARALFEDPNVYGPFLVPIAVIVLEETLRRRTLNLRPLTGILVFGFLAVGIFASFSRAAWFNLVLATIVCLGIISLRRGAGRQALRLLAILALSAVTLFAVVSITGSLSFLEQRAQGQNYDTERFGAQRAGVQLAEEHPAGVGPGQFRFHYPVETHSTYVRVLVEQGFLGLVFWLGLALATLALAVRNAVEGRSTWGIGSAALLGSWCGLLFNSVVVDTLHWRHLWLVAALIWAGALAPAATRWAQR